MKLSDVKRIREVRMDSGVQRLLDEGWEVVAVAVRDEGAASVDGDARRQEAVYVVLGHAAQAGHARLAEPS